MTVTGFKDIQTAAQGDTFQHLITLIAPGAIASAPSVIWIFLRFPAVFSLAEENSVISSLIVLLLIIVVGLILFEVGGFYEIRYLDANRDRATDRAHLEDWYSYLTLELGPDHIGRRYIGRLVVFLKFELAMLFAFPFAAVSFGYLFRNSDIPSDVFWLGIAAMICIASLMRCASKTTHESLGIIRRRILDSVRESEASADAGNRKHFE